MLIGSRRSSTVREVYQNRSRRAINSAIDEIKKSPIFSYVRHVYLYGSCARAEQRFESDVDLLIELDTSFDAVSQKSDLILDLKRRLSGADDSLPDIEAKIVIGNQWKQEQ